jgi:hypothetical protein
MVFRKWRQVNKEKIKLRLVFLLFFIILVLIVPSSSKADTGLFNGKVLTHETDNYLMWLQTRDNSYNYTDRFFIDKVGNVGINTTTPAVKLDIEGGTEQVVDVSGGRIMGLNLIPEADSEAVPRKYLHDHFAPITGGVGSAFVQGGNSFSTTAILGTNDNYDLSFITNGTSRITVDSGGNVGIGTDSPGAKLEVNGTLGLLNNNDLSSSQVVLNGYSSYGLRVQNDVGYVNITPLNGGWAHMYTDRSNFIFNKSIFAIGGKFASYSSSDLTLSAGGSNSSLIIKNTTDNVGIATTTPISKLDVNGLIKMRNYTITEPEDVINKAYLDGFDPGLWLANGNNIYNTNSDNVGIGTNTPTSKLTLADGDFEMTNNKSIKIENSTASTTLHIGNYGDGGGFSYDTGYRANLAVEGDVKGNRICIREDCKATWSGIVSGGMPTGTSGQTLRHNGSGWIANSTIYNDGTSVGIATSTPGTELDVVGDVSASMYYDRDNTNYYVDPEGTAFNYSAIFNKSVGIGTTSPGANLHINTPNTTKAKISGGGTSSYNAVLEVEASSDYRGRGLLMTNRTDNNEWFAGIPYTGSGYTVGYDTTQPHYKANSLFFINSSGNVGIGTVTPNEKLMIWGDSTDHIGINIFNNTYGTNQGNFRLYKTGSTYIITDQRNAAVLENYGNMILSAAKSTDVTTPSIKFQTGRGGTVGNTRMTITSVGDIGIGSTIPVAKLDVAGQIKVGSYGGNDNAVPKHYIDTNFVPLDSGEPASTGSAFVQGGNSFGSTAVLGTNDANDLQLETNGSTRMTIDSGGNVGIGTNAPLSKLDVKGPIIINGGNYSQLGANDVLGGVKTSISGWNSCSSGAFTDNNAGTYCMGNNGATAEWSVSSERYNLDSGVFSLFVGGHWFPSDIIAGGTDDNIGFSIEFWDSGDAIWRNAGNFTGRGWKKVVTPAGIGSGDTEKIRLTVTDDRGGTGRIAEVHLYTTEIAGEWMSTFTGSQKGYFESLSVGSSEYMQSDGNLTVSGDVGIGTSVPGTELDVNGNVSASIYYDRGDTNYYVNPDGAVLNYSAIFKKNVGIGTTSPAQNLEIYASNDPGIRIRESSYNKYFDINYYDSGGLYFAENGNRMIQLHPSKQGLIIGGGYATGAYSPADDGLLVEGNVGIGTTNPGAKLDIEGKLKMENGVINFGSSASHGRLSWDAGKALITSVGTNNLVFQAPYGTDRMTILQSGGNVGIGSTTPQAKLDVAGNIKVGSFGGDADAVPKSYIDSAISGSTYWAPNGDDIYNSNVGNVGIGIGTTAPGSLLTIANDNWVSSLNSAGTGYVNMFKVNSNNQLEFGTAINAGNFEFAPDSGFNTFVDMAVTATPAVGTVEGYTMKIDGNNILSLYSEANGSGGIQNQGVGIGTSNPVSELEVVGIVTATGFSGPLTGTINAANVSSGAFASNTGGGNFSFPANVGIKTTNPDKDLTLSANSVIGFKYNASNDSFHTITGGGTNPMSFTVNPFSADDPIYSFNGNSGNVMTILNGGNIGIGTTNPQAKLHVAGNALISGTLSTQTGSDFAEEFVVSDYIEPGTVVVMGDLGYKSVKSSSEAYDSSVVGVVSDNPSIIAGKVDSEKKAIVAMVGVVSVKVVDEGGEIKRGDLLTSSSVSGYARKADEYVGGTIIGKALEDLKGEKGMVKVLVNLQ